MVRTKGIAIVLIMLCILVLAGASVFAANLSEVTYANSKVTVEGTCTGNQAQVVIFNSNNTPVYFTTVEVENGEFNSILPADFDFEVGKTYTVKVANYDGTEVATKTFVAQGPTYTVTFNTNEGSAVANQTITSGEKATEPTTVPTKANYTFGGWYADSTLTTEFDFDTPITTNTTIYAKWNVIPITTYTVTFNTNGGSVVASQTIKSGATATEPITAPTKTNYTFGGWYADSTLTTEFNFDTPITANITVYAKWNVILTEKTINKTEDNLTVSAVGMFTGNPVLIVTENETGNAGYNILITLVKEDEEVLGSYDISITGGDFKGDLILAFTVGKQYDGDTITIHHKLASGEVETKTAVVKDGKATITVNELSPFMLVAKKEAETKKDETPKTGDNIYVYTILMVTSITGIYVTRKLMKKSK